MVTALLCTLALGAPPPDETSRYFGIYANEHKIGYCAYGIGPDTYNGQKVIKGTVESDIAVATMKSHALATYYFDLDGRPIKTVQESRQGGSSARRVVEYGGDTVTITSAADGKTTTSKVPVPKGIVVTPDVLMSILMSKTPKDLYDGKLYMLDSDDSKLSLVTLTNKGKVSLTVHGQAVPAIWVKMHIEAGPKPDPVVQAMNSKGNNFFFSEDGDVVEVEQIQFLDMIAEPRTVAMGGAEKSLAIDDLFKLKAVGKVPRPNMLFHMKMDIGADSGWEGPPSDDHQTATKTAQGWTLELHPPSVPLDAGFTIKQAWAMQPDWVKPDDRILCDSPQTVSLARKIVGTETDVIKAARKIQVYVAKYMTYDEKAIAIRNTDEIYAAHRGVCVDYAMLACALMRAAGIPTKLVSGLVSPDEQFGTFYGHEWVDVFDGKSWVGIETTSDNDDAQVSANYIEMATGSSEQLGKGDALQAHHPVLKIVSVD